MGPTQKIGEVDSEPNSEDENVASIETSGTKSPTEEIDNKSQHESKENEHEKSSNENPEKPNLQQNSDSKDEDNTTADTVIFSEDEEDLLFDLDEPQSENLDVSAPTQKVEVDIDSNN